MFDIKRIVRTRQRMDMERGVEGAKAGRGEGGEGFAPREMKRKVGVCG